MKRFIVQYSLSTAEHSVRHFKIFPWREYCCSNLLRFAEIDTDRHQSSNPVPIPINRYSFLFIRNDKSYQFDRHDKLLAFIVTCKPVLSINGVYCLTECILVNNFIFNFFQFFGNFFV